MRQTETEIETETDRETETETETEREVDRGQIRWNNIYGWAEGWTNRTEGQMDVDRWMDRHDGLEMQYQMVDDEMMGPDVSVGDAWVMARTCTAWCWPYMLHIDPQHWKTMCMGEGASRTDEGTGDVQVR